MEALNKIERLQHPQAKVPIHPPQVISARPKGEDAIIVHAGSDQVGGVIIEMIGRDDESFFCDLGAQKAVAGRYWSEYAEPTHAMGHGVLLKTGVLPFIAGLFDEGVPNSFESTGRSILSEMKVRNPTQYSATIEGHVYRIDRALKLFGVDLTHDHPDHIGIIPYTRPDLPLHVHPLTWRRMHANELVRGAKYSIESTIHRDRASGRAGGMVYRPIDAYKSWVPYDIGSMTVDHIPMNHSAFSHAQRVTFASGSSIVNTGDFKPPFDALIENMHTRPPSMLLIDGSKVGNPRPAFTETMVRDELTKRMKSIPGSIYAMIPNRQFQRLQSFHDAADATGRKVFIPLSLAYHLHELRMSSEAFYAHLKNIGHPIEGLDGVADLKEYHHLIPDLSNFGIWMQPRSTGKYDKKDYPKAMRDMLDNLHGYEIVELPDLQGVIDKKGVILMTTQSQMKHIMAADKFDPRGDYIHSSSDAYDEKGRLDLGILIRTLQQVGYLRLARDFDSKKVHSGGHASEKELSDFLRQLPNGIETIVPIHTTNPKRFADMVHKIRGEDQHVLWQIDKGRPYTPHGKRIRYSNMPS